MSTTIHVLLVYSHDEQRLLSHDQFREAKAATTAYERAEWDNRENDRIEIVLVAADSIETIMKTHGHYFTLSDSSIFSEFLPQTSM